MTSTTPGRSTMTGTRKGALLLIATALMLAGSAPQVAASDQPATPSIIGPSCPHGATLVRWTNRPWRGWYGCLKGRREVRPRGCRTGYSLKIKRARGDRAYRCRKRRQTQPPRRPDPQPRPQPRVDYQQLLNIAFNKANARYAHDRYSTQYNYTSRVEDGWINARLDANRNVVSPAYAPGSLVGGRYWPEGCKIENTYAVSCTLAELIFDGGNSSLPTRRRVARQKFVVTLGSDGRYSVTELRPDFFKGDVWYWVCFTGPNGEQISGVPNC